MIFKIHNRLVHLKKKILKFIRPSRYSAFNKDNLLGIKLLTRLRVGLSNLRERKFRCNFQDSHCPNYSNQRTALSENISNIKRFLLNQNLSIIVETLLLGSNGLNAKRVHG